MWKEPQFCFSSLLMAIFFCCAKPPLGLWSTTLQPPPQSHHGVGGEGLIPLWALDGWMGEGRGIEKKTAARHRLGLVNLCDAFALSPTYVILVCWNCQPQWVDSLRLMDWHWLWGLIPWGSKREIRCSSLLFDLIRCDTCGFWNLISFQDQL